MRMLVPAIVVLVFLAVPALAAGQAASQPAVRPSVTIPRVDKPPRLEDYMAGEVNAGVRVTGFLQREPGDLVPGSQTTDAYLSYDSTNLYAVFVCRATDPARIRARIARREQVYGDDFVGLFLDPFNDSQRAYMFLSTPLGIQADGITTDTRGDDMSFDTVWHSRGLRTVLIVPCLRARRVVQRRQYKAGPRADLCRGSHTWLTAAPVRGAGSARSLR